MGRFILDHLMSVESNYAFRWVVVDACPGLQMVQQDAPPTPPEVGVPFKGGPVEPPQNVEEVEDGMAIEEDDGYEADDEGEDNP